MTWQAELDGYLAHLRAKGRGEGYRRNVATYIGALGERHAGDGSLLDLTPEDMDAFLGTMRGKGLRGRPVSDATMRAVRALVKGGLRWLWRRRGEVGDPPATRDLVIGRTRPRVDSQADLLTDEEIDRMVRVLPLHHRAVVRLLRATGARPGEILRLRGRDVAWRRKDGREWADLVFRDTKTNDARTVPVVRPDALAALREWTDHSDPGREDPLFPSPRRGGEPLTEGALWSILRRAAQDVGIEKAVFPYLLRHGRASELMDEPRAVVDAVMGWKDGTTWKNYTHLHTEEVLDRLMEREGKGRLTPEIAAERIMDALKMFQEVTDAEGTGLFLERLSEILDEKMGVSVGPVGRSSEVEYYEEAGGKLRRIETQERLDELEKSGGKVIQVNPADERREKALRRFMKEGEK